MPPQAHDFPRVSMSVRSLLLCSNLIRRSIAVHVYLMPCFFLSLQPVSVGDLVVKRLEATQRLQGNAGDVEAKQMLAYIEQQVDIIQNQGSAHGGRRWSGPTSTRA